MIGPGEFDAELEVVAARGADDRQLNQAIGRSRVSSQERTGWQWPVVNVRRKQKSQRGQVKEWQPCGSENAPAANPCERDRAIPLRL